MERIGEADADEALHVTGTAREQLVVSFGQGERVAVPFLAVDGHCVGMAGQHNTWFILRPERRVEIGLWAGLDIFFYFPSAA